MAETIIEHEPQRLTPPIHEADQGLADDQSFFLASEQTGPKPPAAATEFIMRRMMEKL